MIPPDHITLLPVALNLSDFPPLPLRKRGIGFQNEIIRKTPVVNSTAAGEHGSNLKPVGHNHEWTAVGTVILQQKRTCSPRCTAIIFPQSLRAKENRFTASPPFPGGEIADCRTQGRPIKNSTADSENQHPRSNRKPFRPACPAILP